ncbi:sulfurtransferase TusA family protein [Armatimonas sp.]|uniref:sulfurtransferase TusA family protein n=1 Tax=Armatimonas sp. TaxID=1872638 RepID=UPI00374D0DE0
MTDTITEIPDVANICDGGNLDCGSGLLLIIRKAMLETPQSGVLEIRSTEISVREDLPAWCRMTKNPYLGWSAGTGTNRFFVQRGGESKAESDAAAEQAKNYRWRARAHWQASENTVKVYARNHGWDVGQPASFDVKDAAPSAVEYVLNALAACLAMGLQLRASRAGVTIDELEVALSASIENINVFLGLETDGHAGFKEITGTAYVQSDSDDATIQKLWAETLRTSPVANSLTRPVPLTIEVKVL